MSERAEQAATLADQSRWIRVWDPLVRGFHWALVGLLCWAFFTGEAGDEALHFILGYFLISLVLIRLLWGGMGSQHARFSDFVTSPGAVLQYLKQILAGHPPRYLGHNPAGGAMVLCLLLTISVTLVSGLVIQATIEFEGPLWRLLIHVADDTAAAWRLVHSYSVDLLLLLVVLHLLGVVLASLQHGENLITSMIHGNKKIKD